MLADQVLSAPPQPDCGLMGYPVTAMVPVLERLRRAQKFTLDPAFAAAADALSTEYGSLAKAFPFCRLPFPVTWFEVAQSHRPQFAAAKIHAPLFQSRPLRIGFLCIATRADLSAWRAHLFWNLEEHGCNAASMAIGFDMNRTPEGAAAVEWRAGGAQPLSRSEYFPNATTIHPGWANASAETREALLQHTFPEQPDYGWPIMPDELWTADAGMRGQIFSLLGDLARSDWAGEISFLLAVIGLLNSRNFVIRERVDRSKMNKARRRAGKPPMLDHYQLKIHPRQLARANAGAPGGGEGHGPLRMHVCRGHWKVRASGIYFWRAHWRGDRGRGEIAKSYTITT